MANHRTFREALITGSSSGIGAAFARVLPAETNLLLTGRNSERLETLAGQLARPGRRIRVLSADLGTDAGRNAVIEAAHEAAVDLFVCNAGVGHFGPFTTTSIAAERNSLAVNVIALTELLHALVPIMIANARQNSRRGGLIVSSSAAAFSLAPGLATYGASKAYQKYLTLTLAAELHEEPLDILCLCPTYTHTGFFSQAGIPEPSRAMTPEAVANEALAALGRDTLHLCGFGLLPQAVQQLVSKNPVLDPRTWVRRLLR
jgi:short-subunit dehydrogenase